MAHTFIADLVAYIGLFIGGLILIAVICFFRKPERPRKPTVKWVRRAPPPRTITDPIRPGHFRIQDTSGKTYDVPSARQMSRHKRK